MSDEATPVPAAEVSVSSQDGGIPESVWNNPEFIAAAEDLRDAVSIFNDPSFQRVLNSAPGTGYEIGFSAQEYAENHQQNPTMFPATFSTERPDPKSTPQFLPSWKDVPDDLKPVIPDTADSYPQFPADSVLRNSLEIHGGKLPITSEVVNAVVGVSRSYGAQGVRILTATTAETDAEKSLLAEMEKAAAKIGLPQQDGVQVIPPLFVMQGMDLDKDKSLGKDKSNAMFFGDSSAILFTEHYVKDPKYMAPAVQEGTALHELGHGLQPSHALPHALQNYAYGLSKAGEAAMTGAMLSSAVMVAGAYGFEGKPLMEDVALLRTPAIVEKVQASGIEAHHFEKDVLIGLLGAAAVAGAGAALGASAYVRQKNEFDADAKAIELGDHPEQIIEKAKGMQWKHSEVPLEERTTLINTAREIMGCVLGMEDPYSTHPSTDARVANMQQVNAARQQRESGGFGR